MAQQTDKLRYEVLLLTVPEITADEIKALESDFQKTITKDKGEVLSFERWGKYHLAYEVRKNEYGVYFLARFELSDDDPQKTLEALHDFFTVKYSDLVMRAIKTRLALDAPLTYKRPESLEEMPQEGAREGYAQRGDARDVKKDASALAKKPEIGEEGLEDAEQELIEEEILDDVVVEESYDEDEDDAPKIKFKKGASKREIVEDDEDGFEDGEVE